VNPVIYRLALLFHRTLSPLQGDVMIYAIVVILFASHPKSIMIVFSKDTNYFCQKILTTSRMMLSN